MSRTAASIEHVTLGGAERNALTKSRSSSGEPAEAVSTFFRSSLRFLRSTLFALVSRRSICPHSPNALLTKLSVLRTDEPCRSPATKKGRCRLHDGASGSGGPPPRGGTGKIVTAGGPKPPTGRERISAFLEKLRARPAGIFWGPPPVAHRTPPPPQSPHTLF